MGKLHRGVHQEVEIREWRVIGLLIIVWAKWVHKKFVMKVVAQVKVFILYTFRYRSPELQDRLDHVFYVYRHPLRHLAFHNYVEFVSFIALSADVWPLPTNLVVKTSAYPSHVFVIELTLSEERDTFEVLYQPIYFSTCPKLTFFLK